MALREWFDDFFVQVWGTSDPAAVAQAVDRLVHVDCLVHGLPHEKNIARQGFVQLRQLFLNAFDRTEVTIDEHLVEGERIAFRATFRAWKGGKLVTAGGGGMARVRDGQIVEAWNQWDFLGLLHQLEAVHPEALVSTLARLAR